MAVILVSRHKGAIEWIQNHAPFTVTEHVLHLDPEQVQSGDIIIGTLPINMVATITNKGAIYWHIAMPMQYSQRGHELSYDDMIHLNVKLERYEAHCMALL